MIYQGINIIESADAVSKPKGCIHTDDMRAMIDHFEELGLIQMVPASFRLPNGSIAVLVGATDMTNDIWFRYDDSDVVYTHEPYEWNLKVIRYTAKCAVLDFYGKPKFVLLKARKRFAYPTRELAMESYIIRKNRQMAYAAATHHRAKMSLEAAKAFRDRGFERQKFENPYSLTLMCSDANSGGVPACVI